MRATIVTALGLIGCGPTLKEDDGGGGAGSSGTSAGPSPVTAVDSANPGCSEGELFSEKLCRGLPPPDLGDSSSGAVTFGSTGTDSTGTGSSSDDTGGTVGSTDVGSSSGAAMTDASTTAAADPCAGWGDGDAPSPDQGAVEQTEGPWHEDGRCCWDVTYRVGADGCGRPFLVGPSHRVAAARRRDDWGDRPRPRVDDLDARTRERLAAAWLGDALAEHASIAAFARFALQLLALGAPPQLLADTHRAMDDELEHARLCFALASAYAGRELGPGPLAIEGALADATSLEQAVVATIREGCIAETLAAVQAEIARERAEDPVVADVLARIAVDEARHAALAWRFVRWAVERGGPRIRDAAERAFERELPSSSSDDATDLRRHGRLGAAELAALHRDAYALVIRPCAAAVLDSAQSSTRPMPASSIGSEQ